MKTLLAVVLPPLAVWRCHAPRQLRTSVLLTIAGWIPGVVHAIWLVHHWSHRRSHPQLGRPNPFGAA